MGGGATPGGLGRGPQVAHHRHAAPGADLQVHQDYLRPVLFPPRGGRSGFGDGGQVAARPVQSGPNGVGYPGQIGDEQDLPHGKPDCSRGGRDAPGAPPGRLAGVRSPAIFCLAAAFRPW